MRIILTGSVVFAIWAFFSTWLFVDVLKPALKKPVLEAVVPKPTDNVADSLARIYALMPKDLVIRHDFDKALFRPDAETESRLAEFKSWLDNHPESVLLISGHTDLVGTPEYNQNLGLERAQGAFEFLKGKGFPESRMTIVSKGEQEPAAGYITTEERAKNRRTVISIKK